VIKNGVSYDDGWTFYCLECDYIGNLDFSFLVFTDSEEEVVRAEKYHNDTNH
jgi:hypothetical protein